MAVDSCRVLRDRHGVYGAGLMRASLLCGAACGGDIVLSAVAHEIVQDWLAKREHAVYCLQTSLCVIAEPAQFNWRERHRTPSLAHLFPGGLKAKPKSRQVAAATVCERVFRLLPAQLTGRLAFFAEAADLYQHQRCAYNPHWWMAYCGYSPSCLPPANDLTLDSLGPGVEEDTADSVAAASDSSSRGGSEP
ncbi:hypothetical protein DIPPA_08313 [Diplonema papillatum]|nr:hypothetical protein DIPPA_08313 [Diplonema papillatum]